MADKGAIADKGALSISDEPPPSSRRGGILGAIDWYAAWALPGMGMFSEAYIVFSSGQIGVFQQVLAPTCYGSNSAAEAGTPSVALAAETDCPYTMVAHVASYVLIIGIMAGMLLWGFIGDITGRMWGSRCVSAIMLSGCILLTFSAYAPTAYGYFAYYVTAQTWYGFGVGGEYPMASSSAAERSSTTPELRAYRGRQVVLVFSNQGMGNFVNACVILICMAIFNANGTSISVWAARQVLVLMYGFGATACLVMVLYRFIFLRESELFANVSNMEKKLAAQENISAFQAGWRKHMTAYYYFWPRQLVASVAWVCNDFAFYGNKLQQNVFITLLYPTATPYKKQQWTVLNNFIALLGYYTAAWLIDRPSYGRVHMQAVGFIAMFVFYIIIYGQWNNMGNSGDRVYILDPATGLPVEPYAALNPSKYNTRLNPNTNGMHAFQALYYLASFFNQFGPNATTWLVAGEIFPTEIRATNHGIAACMGKLGAIISALWISYIDTTNPLTEKWVFLISAIWGIGGAIVTYIWLPDTTGLELEEYDRLHRYMSEHRFHEYAGEAVNRKHLSYWEVFVFGWHNQYNREQDKKNFEEEVARLATIPEAMNIMGKMSVVDQETFIRVSKGSRA